MNTIQSSVLEKLQTLSLEQQAEVLLFVESLYGHNQTGAPQDASELIHADLAVERQLLLKLSLQERRQVLEKQAEEMADHYQQDLDWQKFLTGDIVEY
jgi:hypothetical protein